MRLAQRGPGMLIGTLFLIIGQDRIIKRKSFSLKYLSSLINHIYFGHPIRLALRGLRPSRKRVDRNPNFEHWLLGQRPQQGLHDQIIKRISLQESIITN